MRYMIIDMIITKTPQNDHWAIRMTFIFDVKIDLIMFQLHVKLIFVMNLIFRPAVLLFDI